MAVQASSMTIHLPTKVRPLLDSMVGDTLEQKIAGLLLDAVRHNLEACEQERLELEIKYGLEYGEFRRKLDAGDLGNEFEYALETDVMRWDDLIAEKKHWLQQVRYLKALTMTLAVHQALQFALSQHFSPVQNQPRKKQ